VIRLNVIVKARNSWRVVLAGLVLAAGCSDKIQSQSMPPSKGERQPGIDLAALDRQANPCSDFYQFACGGWLADHPLTPDTSFEATWVDPYYDEADILWPILKQSVTAAPTSAEERLVSDFYRSCLAAPHQQESRQRVLQLQRMLDGVSSVAELASVVAAYARLGSGSFFWFFVDHDPAEATRHLLAIRPGGRELPDRSYYLEPKYAALRQSYLEHIRALAALLGVSINPDSVLAIETELATADLPPAQERNPRELYHPLSLDQVVALAPHFPWAAYVEALGITGPDRINVVSPSYLTALDALLVNHSLDQLRDYVRWQLLEDEASRLDQAFEDEQFAFHDRLLLGESSPQPRDWVCYGETTRRLGFEVSRQYLSRLFPPSMLTSERSLIHEIRGAMRARLTSNRWLDEPTRTEALAKLDKIVEKVGWPDVWPTLPGLTVTGTWLDTHLARNQAYHLQAVASLKEPVDRTSWRMPPIEVNAYYAPDFNEIVFPAAIFRLPFFDPASGSAVNHGAIGAVMGHELTHAFDDAGRQFDGDGTLRNWWSADVEAAFHDRSACLVDAFSRREPLIGQHVDGVRTLGENIADLGGIELAFEAWQASGAATTAMAEFGGAQQLFIAYAQTSCALMSPGYLATVLATDPHSPPKERVNVPLSFLDSFADAFHCPTGSPMRARPACAVW
jgi:putative endopeptidase